VPRDAFTIIPPFFRNHLSKAFPSIPNTSSCLLLSSPPLPSRCACQSPPPFFSTIRDLSPQAAPSSPLKLRLLRIRFTLFFFSLSKLGPMLGSPFPLPLLARLAESRCLPPRSFPPLPHMYQDSPALMVLLFSFAGPHSSNPLPLRRYQPFTFASPSFFLPAHLDKLMGPRTVPLQWPNLSFSSSDDKSYAL